MFLKEINLFNKYNHVNILRKTIEGYSDSISSQTFNTKKAKLNIHAVHDSRYFQSKLKLNLSHASMVKLQYCSKWLAPLK